LVDHTFLPTYMAKCGQLTVNVAPVTSSV